MQGSRGFIHREARRPISPLDSRPASSRMQTAARHLSMMTGDETDWPFVTRSTAALSLPPSSLSLSSPSPSCIHAVARREIRPNCRAARGSLSSTPQPVTQAPEPRHLIRAVLVSSSLDF